MMPSQTLLNIACKCLRFSRSHPKGDNQLLIRRLFASFNTDTRLSFRPRTHRNINRCAITDTVRSLQSQLANHAHTSANEDLDNDTSSIHSDTESVQLSMKKNMIIINDFITEEEEQRLVEEVEPYLKRLRYESSHWDDAIHSYRETERKQWREVNKSVIQRIRDVAFPKDVNQLAFVHILDLSKEGYIKPHVDAVRFCGNTIAGLSLLSPAVMRLVHTKDSSKQADILLNPRSIYIMKDEARYDYTHEVLQSENSFFKSEPIPRERRIAVICRNEPN